MVIDLARRKFIAALGGAVAWPLNAWAQQLEPMRRIGVLIGTGADNPQGQAGLAAFLQGLQQLGWTADRNLRIETRWGAGNAADTRKYAVELVALAPDVILATGSTAGPLLEATRTVPIVFVIAPDPVGAGFVHSLSRPGGNATGFMMLEYSLCGKWLELLKEIAPGVTRAAILRDTSVAAGIGQFAVIQSMSKNDMVFGVVRYDEICAIALDRNLAPPSISTRLEDVVSNYRHDAPLKLLYRIAPKGCGGSSSTSKGR